MSLPIKTPQPASVRTIASDGAAQTECMGRAISAVLTPGDLVAVSGELGAGKSVLCRAIVRALMADNDLEVPSPSYTLVNVYDRSDFEIWHADLYRVGDDSELEEIGLDDAVSDAVVLLEWPERWTDLPERRLHIAIQVTGDDERHLKLTFSGEGWDRLIRQLEPFA